MAVTLSPATAERLAQVRYARKSVTFVSMAGLKIAANRPPAKLFTGWSWGWLRSAQPQPVNNFGEPIRVVGR